MANLIFQVAGVGKDVWSMGSKISNSIFKPKKVEAETAASTPCEATTSHQVLGSTDYPLSISHIFHWIKLF